MEITTKKYLENCSYAQLKKIYKEIEGKGVKPGVSKDDLVDAVYAGLINKDTKEVQVIYTNAGVEFQALDDGTDKTVQLAKSAVFESTPEEFYLAINRKELKLAGSIKIADTANISVIQGQYVYAKYPEYQFDTLEDCVAFRKAVDGTIDDGE